MSPLKVAGISGCAFKLCYRQCAAGIGISGEFPVLETFCPPSRAVGVKQACAEAGRALSPSAFIMQRHLRPALMLAVVPMLI